MKVRSEGSRFLMALGGALLAIVACSRNAQQTNFLGKACTGEGDCPAELLCVINACREPCAPNGACDDGYQCQLGACVPGGTVTPGSPGDPGDSGTREPTPPPNTNPGPAGDSGAGLPGSGAGLGDGTAMRSDIPMDIEGSAFDDERIVYVRSTQDAFGVRTTKLYAAPYAGGTSEIMTLSDGAPREFLLLGGDAYYIDDSNGQPNAKLTRRAPTAGATAVPLADASGSTAMQRFGTKIVFTDPQGALRVWETATSKLDATLYQPAADRWMASLQATTLSWLGGGMGAPYTVYSATLGGAGSATKASFPEATDVAGFAVSGTQAVIVTGSGNVIGIDTTTNKTQTLGTIMHGAREMPVEEGRLYFVDDGGASGSDAKLVRMDATGARTTLGSLGTAGASQLTLTASSVYALQGTVSGFQVSKWAKPL